MDEPRTLPDPEINIEMGRDIDALCRRFEADWGEGLKPTIDEYLGEIPEPGRRALRAELETLVNELRAADAASPGRSSATVAEAPTIAPTAASAGPTIHDDATVGPRVELTVDFKASTATPVSAAGPDRLRYFGDYEIVRELARGGMGVVFLARQVSLNRPVALKMILAGQLANETDIKRFYTEAEAAANLDHPGIVPIYEVGQHDGQHYFSMGFVEGQSLSQRLIDGPLPPRDAAELMIKVADAIDYAHHQGVIHRDLKPGNILLDRNGNRRVTDFGLAKKLQGDSGLTGSGQIMGTPSYMPPEQAGANRGEIGPAADVYALGATLYALVTGRPPFQAATAMDTVLQVVGEEPVPPRRLNAGVPRDLETICLKCLQKEPPKRYDGAAALARDLQRFLAGEPILARPSTRLEHAVKWARRRPAIAGLAAALTVALVVGFSGMALLWARAEDNAAIARRNELQAEESARIERDARAESQRQTTIATERAEALRRQDYVNRVNLAYRECLDDNIAHAIELLDGCPEDLRGWEWHYVNRQCHLDLMTFRDQAPSVNAVAFSPDGRRVATASGLFLNGGTGNVVVHDAMTAKEVFAHRGLSPGIHAMAYSPDGRWLAAGVGSTVALWDAATGKERFKMFHAGLSAISSLAFTPDSRRILAGYQGGTGYALLWDVETGKKQGDAIVASPGGVSSLAISPDGRQAALACKGQVDLWDLQTHRQVRAIPGHDDIVYAVAFSPDGRYIASGGLDRTVRLWDAATGAEVRRYIGHQGFVRGVAFSPDGRRLVTCAEDKSIKLWSVDSDRELATFHGHHHYVIGVAFSPDGHRIASGSSDHTAKIWPATAEPQLTFRGHTGWVTTVAFSRDGKRIASGASLYSTGHLFELWDSRTGEPIGNLPDENVSINAVVFSPSGRTLATSGKDGFVRIRDATTGMPRGFVRGKANAEYEPTGIAYSPDSKRLATVSNQSTVNVIDGATGQVLLVLKGHEAEVDAVAFSPDGRKMATGSGDKTVRIWDAATGASLQVFRGHTVGVDSVAFSPDGGRVASVGGVSQQLGEVKVWEVATGREAFPIRGHTDKVSGVAFSPDGRRLATASEDRTIKLWDTTSGQEVFTLRGHTSGVICVAFSPDGQQMASGSIDRTAKVWDTGPPDFDQMLRRMVAPQVAELFRSLLLRDDVVDHIRRDPKLDQTTRPLALEVAENRAEDPMALNNRSWLIVREPGRTAEDYHRALRYVEAATRLQPRESMFLNTLGVARYRCGRFEDALADLTRSSAGNAPRYGGSIPADLAFIAMARHRLGKRDEAREALGQLREAASRSPWSDDDESTGFLDEAAALIAGTEPPIIEVRRFQDESRQTVESATFSPDGRGILTCSADGALRLWDRASGRLIRAFDRRGGRLMSVAFSPDGRRALAGGEDHILRLWDVQSGALVREFRGHTEWVFHVAFSADGRLAYSTSGGPDPGRDGRDFAVRVWDVETGQEIRRLEGHKGRVVGLDISPDGRRVLTGGDTRLILWDAASGSAIRRLEGHSQLVQNVVFLKGGLRAASASGDRTVRLWDLETGQELHRFLGHPIEVVGLAASPDGRRLLSSDYNGRELRLWDVEGMKLIRRIGWGFTPPTRGSFSPDGRYAAWGGADGSVRLYRLAPLEPADGRTDPREPELKPAKS